MAEPAPLHHGLPNPPHAPIAVQHTRMAGIDEEWVENSVLSLDKYKSDDDEDPRQYRHRRLDDPVGEILPVFSDHHDQPSPSLFVKKLWAMLEDDITKPYIYWNGCGEVFTIANPNEFSKQILPLYFNHRKFQSFVRQLNMYGFRKVSDEACQLKDVNYKTMAEKATKNFAEFSHPFFIRHRRDLIGSIKRKTSNNRSSNANSMVRASQNSMLSSTELHENTKQVVELEEKLAELNESHNLLWESLLECRQKLQQQHNWMQNVSEFLFTAFGEETSDETALSARKRRKMEDLFLMHNTPEALSHSPNGITPLQRIRENMMTSQSEHPRVLNQAGDATSVSYMNTAYTHAPTMDLHVASHHQPVMSFVDELLTRQPTTMDAMRREVEM